MSFSLFIRFWLVLTVLLISYKGIGQESKVKSFALEQYLKSVTTDDYSQVSFFVKGDVSTIRKAVQYYRGKIKGCIKGWVFVSVPSNKLRSFIRYSDIESVNFRTYKGTPLNDTMRVNNRINAIFNGQQPLDTKYTGEGVIIGFIDTGIDWKHPDFLNPQDSSTRIISLWDQTKPNSSFTPSQYGYGEHWDSTQIMQNLSTNQDIYGHGSTVAGTACGNAFANGLNRGVAPQSDLIVVESDFNAGNWLGTVVDAVEYIYHIADSLGKPCVINASLGTYLGSHDGLDPYTLYIDSLIKSKQGHLMVASAGNSGNWGNYHLHTTVTTDTNITWFKYNATQNAVYFELWADTNQFNSVSFTVGLDQVTPVFSNRGKGNYYNINTNLGGVIYDTIKNSSNQQLATVQYWAEQRDGQYLLQVYLPVPDSNQYYFRFETVGNGSFDCWSTSILGMSDMVSDISSVNSFIESNKYVFPDSLQTIVSAFQCSPNIIAVGNYYNDSGYVNLDTTWTSNGGVRGALAETSSRGPTRDGRIKPEIAASGHGVNSAIPFHIINYYLNHPTLDSTLAIGGMHRRNGGTSMASPIVAGVGALLLEKCNKISPSQFKEALINQAYSDAFTGTLPNYSFGYGKLDGFETIKYFSYENILVGSTSFCEGDSSLLSIANTVENYNWDNSNISESIYVSETANHFVVTTDSLGCRSDTLFFSTTKHPLPLVPQLSSYYDSIVAIGVEGNMVTWFLDGVPIVSTTDSSLYVQQNGDYYISVTNNFGCVNYSDTIFYGSVGIESKIEKEVFFYPNPANKFIVVQSSTPFYLIEMYSLEGRKVKSWQFKNKKQVKLEFDNQADGVYLLKLFTSEKTDVKKIIIDRRE